MIRFLTTAAFFLMAIGVGTADDLVGQIASVDDTSSPRTNEQIVGFIVEQLKESPYWIGMSPDQIDLRNELTQTYFEIAQFDTRLIREALEAHIGERDFSSDNYFVDTANIFVLLRVVFDVPEQAPVAETKLFGAWGGPADKDGVAFPLWPFEVDSDGELILTGGYGVYMGAPYSFFGEFDYFSETYGRRPIPEKNENAAGSSEPAEGHPDKRYYYVRVLGGEFPIPVRFGVVLPKSVERNEPTLQLISPVIKFSKLDTEAKIASLSRDTGHIRIGSMPGYKLPDTGPNGLVDLSEEIKLYGLNIRIYVLRSETRSDTEGQNLIVLINDNDNYVLISDQNNNLWKELLREFARFNSIEY